MNSSSDNFDINAKYTKYTFGGHRSGKVLSLRRRLVFWFRQCVRPFFQTAMLSSKISLAKTIKNNHIGRRRTNNITTTR
ncbi:MAG: hypothetical protein LBQ66_08585 [Planctomycetaceae bacterium]|nr:hypothetical protein [Planctomycetaceae bacterium]